MMALDLGWVDIGMLGFLLLSVGVGAVRGIVFELLSLVGWLAAFLVARWWTPALQSSVHVGDPASALNHGATFACVFVATLIIWGLASRIVRALIRSTALSFLDRGFGAGFGLLRGAVILLLVAAVVGLSPWSDATLWQRSHGAGWLEALLRELRPLFRSPQSPFPSA
jgi:membrane protein required for colicin V production